MRIDENKLRSLRLVLFDLDGTLLNDNGEIGQESIRLVTELQKYGVQFSFASGRLHSALTQYADQLHIHTPIISLDGACIKSHPDGRAISTTFIPQEKVEKAVAYGDLYLMKYALCHADAIYFTEHNATIPDLMDKFGAKFIEVDSYDGLFDKTLEILFISDYKEKLRYVRKKMSFPYTWGLVTSYSKSVTNEGLYFLEIRKKGSNKASGLSKLIKYLRINIRETAVIGDWYNDISLFETDAIKVALDNAVMDIKDRADIITHKNNNQDGVAEFLDMVLKAKMRK
ncbi:MAG: Cof-type HAD-IIB family hydrolase [Ignavibacteria bacterium]|nr:Cof-type HAD-IIB family hydrolase [Ignavibacteria bacterium]